MGVVVVGMITSAIGVIKNGLDMPVVYQDANTKMCVAVEDPNGLRSCTSAWPKKYETAYVRPGTTYQDLLKRR